MQHYFINTKAREVTGEHEVHSLMCRFLPRADHLIPLGEHPSCFSALEKAKEAFQTADGCMFCCLAIHKS